MVRNTLIVIAIALATGSVGVPAWADADERDQLPRDAGSKALSAEEAAKELANPNTPLATLNFTYQIRRYDGDLPDADGQVGQTLLFQPAFPFKLDNGDVVFFRPGIPIQLRQPVFDPSSQGFDDKFGLGDIGFDLVYGQTYRSGVIVAWGGAGTLPSATSSKLGSGRFSLGPEVLVVSQRFGDLSLDVINS